jgi:hypothetical protein
LLRDCSWVLSLEAISGRNFHQPARSHRSTYIDASRTFVGASATIEMAARLPPNSQSYNSM